MPRLRALAAESTCYSRFYAASNFTTPTTSTLETGTLPWTHFASQLSAKVHPALRQHTLAAALRSQGYRTYTTTDNLLASPLQHATDAGYQRQAMSPSRMLRDRVRTAFTLLPETSLPLLVDTALSFLGAFDVQWFGSRNPYDSARVLDQALPWLSEAPGPAFVWVHSMPPHSPYLPPAATKHSLLPAGELDRWSDFLEENSPYATAQQGLVDKHRLRYREGIMAVDAAVGHVVDELRRAGRLDRTVLIVTADHGESFEKGFIGHASPALHEALIRIPLLVHLPGQHEGRRVDTPVSQADLAPSVLELVGAPPLPHAEGRSLAANWRGAALGEAPVLVMSMERQSRFAPIRQGHYAIVDGPYKLIVHLPGHQVSLYDLAKDPGENTDLSTTQPAVRERLLNVIEQRLAQAESRRRSLSP
jgi:arylsulfatase A-like enzyme